MTIANDITIDKANINAQIRIHKRNFLDRMPFDWKIINLDYIVNELG